jgi:hypothetical protein
MKYILLLFIPLLLFGQKQRRCPGSAYTDSYTKIEARNGWQADIEDTSNVLRQEWASDIGDSMAVVSDTTALKLSNSRSAYLIGLTTSNLNGSGFFNKRDSIYSEGIIAFNHSEQGKQFIRIDYLSNKEINVLWSGVLNDCTSAVNNNVCFNHTFQCAYENNASKTIVPEGKYLIKPDAYDAGGGDPNFGLRLRPNAVLEGAGENKTILYASDTTSSLIYADIASAQTVNFEDRNYTIRNMTMVGSKKGEIPRNLTTEQGAGITLKGVGETVMNKVLLENITVKYFFKESFKNSNVYKVIYNNCTVIGNTFIAFDPGAQHTVLNNCYVDTCYIGLEWYGKANVIDSISTITINGFTANNVWSTGAQFLGGAIATLDQVNLTCVDSGYTMHGYGISINPISTYNNDGTIYFNISNSYISGFGLYGISRYGIAQTAQMVDISINETKITECGRSGIYINPSDTVHSISINDCIIINNNVSQYNNANGAAIVIKDIDRVTIENNYITNNQAGLRGIPVTLNNCNNAIIRNNDFTGTSLNYIYVDALNGIKVENNKGLYVHQAITVGLSAYYYQNWMYHNNGFWLGDSIGFKFHIMDNDSLMVTKYNSSGVAGDTTSVAK